MLILYLTFQKPVFLYEDYEKMDTDSVNCCYVHCFYQFGGVAGQLYPD